MKRMRRAAERPGLAIADVDDVGTNTAGLSQRAVVVDLAGEFGAVAGWR